MIQQIKAKNSPIIYTVCVNYLWLLEKGLFCLIMLKIFYLEIVIYSNMYFETVLSLRKTRNAPVNLYES